MLLNVHVGLKQVTAAANYEDKGKAYKKIIEHRTYICAKQAQDSNWEFVTKT